MFFFRKKTIPLFRRDGLYLAPSKKGRGLFCAAPVKAGDIIETVPLMVFTEEETPLLEKTRLRHYLWAASILPRGLRARERVKDVKASSFFPAGMSAFCNHRRDANAEIEFSDEFHTGYFTLAAVSDIPANTEIFVNYGAPLFAFRLEREGQKAGKKVPVPGEAWREEKPLAAATLEPARVSMRPGLYLKWMPKKGRSVFCHENIAQGDVIELAPAILLSGAEAQFSKETKLDDYVFDLSRFPPEAIAAAGLDKPDGVATGMGVYALCNHLRVPNVKLMPQNDGYSAFFALTAIKDIPKDTEICIDYGISWFSNQQLLARSAREKHREAEEEK